MTYTIDVAINSGCSKYRCLHDVKIRINSTDSWSRGSILESPENSGDRCPDILWVNEAVEQLSKLNLKFDAICILRPTSQNLGQRQCLSEPRFALKHIISLRAIRRMH